MPFKPGVSGNPKGRPPGGLSLAERIREKGGQDGSVYVELLHGIAMDESEVTKVRLDAVKTLMDRGYGRLPQEVQVGATQEAMRATELRRTLKEAGLLDGAGEQQSSSSAQLQRWAAGDLDWDTEPSG